MSDPSAVFAAHLASTIGRFSDDRARHKRTALSLKMSTSGLGALATVFLGWHASPYADLLKDGALVLTASITLLAAYDAFFEPRKLWVRDTMVLNSLMDLQREWELRAAGAPLPPEAVMTFSTRFHDILKKSLKEWTDAKQSVT